MKTQLSVLIVSAMLVASTGLTPSFAQVVEPIVVSTDMASYSDGDTVIVSGEVKDMLTGTPVSMRVFAANGNVVAVEQITIGPDRKFSVELTAGGSLWSSSGEYRVSVLYGSTARTAETTFEFGGSTGSMPTPTPTPGPDPAPGTQTFSVDAGEAGTFNVGYSITGGSITGMMVDGDTSSLTVMIDAVDDGQLMLTLPRNVIDAKMNVCDGDDGDFFTLVDAEEVEFMESKTSMDRTLTIEFSAGAEEIEIIGTCAVPEFGTIAALILAAAIISIIAVSARSRLSIIPKY